MIQAYKDAAQTTIMAPFFGKQVPVTLRELTDVQIRSCGDFSLIETLDDKIAAKKKPTVKQISEYAEKMEMICRMSMISPTYDEVIELCKVGPEVKKIEAELKELSDMAAMMDPGPKKTEVMDLIAEKNIWVDLLLPADFTATVVSYSLGIHKSDIKLISDDMLYDAACLAKLGKDNPSDHLDGNFSSFNRFDIDRRAWQIFEDRRPKK